MDLEPFDMADIGAGLEDLGTRPPREFETAFPGTPKLIEAIKIARALRMQDSGSVWKACGVCEDCKDSAVTVVNHGFVLIVKPTGERCMRARRSQCYEAWRAQQGGAQ